MHLGEYIKILLLILLSSVKFIAGPPFAYSFNKQYEFGFGETVLYSIIGGMLGVVIFTFFSEQVFKLWRRFKHRVKKVVGKGDMFSKPEADVDAPLEVHYEFVEEKKEGQRKIFSSRNRRFIKIWRTYGLIGIAFLTPVIISIPIGTILANSLVHNRKKIFLYMFVSILFWSFLINGFFELYQIKTQGLIRE